MTVCTTNWILGFFSHEPRRNPNCPLSAERTGKRTVGQFCTRRVGRHIITPHFTFVVPTSPRLIRPHHPHPTLTSIPLHALYRSWHTSSSLFRITNRVVFQSYLQNRQPYRLSFDSGPFAFPLSRVGPGLQRYVTTPCGYSPTMSITVSSWNCCGTTDRERSWSKTSLVCCPCTIAPNDRNHHQKVNKTTKS